MWKLQGVCFAWYSTRTDCAAHKHENDDEHEGCEANDVERVIRVGRRWKVEWPVRHGGRQHGKREAAFLHPMTSRKHACMT